MFTIDTDKTISITRGDSGSFVAPIDYALQLGDVLRLKVFRKKACEDVVLQKDFAIGEATETVTLELTEKDTRIGGVISKPVDYWYEIELNPDNNPKTLVGYDEDGAKIFKLYPEGRDLEDDELSEEEVDTLHKLFGDFKNEIYDYVDEACGDGGADGKDGISATHSWNGTVLTVTSASGTSSADLKGEKGDTGANGSNGKDGSDGTDGVGIKSVVQTTTSSADGGSNVITVTKTDNTTSTFTVKNGSKGSKGDKGDTGAAGKDGSDYVLTEADKAEIVAMVIESLGGNPVFGYVDENNNIIVSGNLADGSYNVKYEMEDGSMVDIGDLVLDTRTYYTVKNNLTNCTSNNNTTEAVEGGSYSATITAKSGYELKSVTVTMGGSPVSVSGGVINIASVTGNIVITAVAEEIKANYTNLADPTSTDWAVASRFSSGGVVTPIDGLTADISNYIPVENGSVVRVKGMNLTNKLSNGSTTRQALYTLDGTSKAFLSVVDTSATHKTYVTDEGNGVQSITISSDLTTALDINYPVKFIRLNGTLTVAKEDVIITVNEEI